MRHDNSVLHQMLKRIPWERFDAVVEEHEADRRVRKLSTKSQLIALLYGQLSQAASLREIVGGLGSHRARLYHLGAKAPCRSTLADANLKRPAAVFGKLLEAMMAMAHRSLRRSLADATYLIDSTGLRLDTRSASWARFSAGVCGAKLHVIYDAQAGQPVYAAISAANVNDITPAQQMPLTPGATYVFDLGYYDYKWWAELDAAGCRIVTRFKKNTPLSAAQELVLPEDSPILSDRTGFLPKRQTNNRHNPMAKTVREVRVRTESGKILRLLSNDLDAPAQQIADLYKRRWAIELFFRWIKQTLKIRHFLGTSENAVRIQIAVALIAFLLLRLAHAAQIAVEGPLAFARLVRANLMHRRPIGGLLEADPPPLQSRGQMELLWA